MVEPGVVLRFQMRPSFLLKIRVLLFRCIGTVATTGLPARFAWITPHADPMDAFHMLTSNPSADSNPRRFVSTIVRGFVAYWAVLGLICSSWFNLQIEGNRSEGISWPETMAFSKG